MKEADGSQLRLSKWLSCRQSHSTAPPRGRMYATRLSGPGTDKSACNLIARSQEHGSEECPWNIPYIRITNNVGSQAHAEATH